MNQYPYGYCGMPCALCSRYHTQGTSRCPGCSFDGYYTDTCKVHHCCKEKSIEHCGNCDEFPCVRLGKMGDFKDLNTNHAKVRICSAIAKEGFDKWYHEYSERADLLTEALQHYNDGRMKRYLCELFIVQDISVLQFIMKEAEKLEGTPKEIGKAFKKMVDSIVTSS